MWRVLKEGTRVDVSISERSVALSLGTCPTSSIVLMSPVSDYQFTGLHLQRNVWNTTYFLEGQWNISIDVSTSSQSV